MSQKSYSTMACKKGEDIDATQEAKLFEDIGALKARQEDTIASLDRLRERVEGHITMHPTTNPGNPSHNNFRIPHVSRGQAAGGAGWTAAIGLGIYELVKWLS